MQTLCIRSMLESDLPAIHVIEKALYAFPWENDIFLRCLRIGYDCWVLASPEGVQGYAVMSINANHEAHLLNIAINKTWQRQGLARQLLWHLLEVAKQKGATYIFLEVRISNAGAIKLYEQMGFQQIEKRPGYYPAAHGAEDALVFGKNIT